jgi:hypothetical protein
LKLSSCSPIDSPFITLSIAIFADYSHGFHGLHGKNRM